MSYICHTMCNVSKGHISRFNGKSLLFKLAAKLWTYRGTKLKHYISLLIQASNFLVIHEFNLLQAFNAICQYFLSLHARMSITFLMVHWHSNVVSQFTTIQR